MNLSSKIELVNVSDTGMQRPHNEDSAITDPAIGLAVVADGMGGYRAGEVASAIAAKTILNTMRGELQAAHNDPRNTSASLSAESALVRDSILDANRHIFRTATEVPQYKGMGTTVVVVLFYNNIVTVAHVGDSRVYRLRNGNLAQITTDHSLAQELINQGLFTAEEAETNTPKNWVTRALGVDEKVEVDIQEQVAESGDVYLLCSDGLNDMINDEEIRLTLNQYSCDLSGAAHELVRLANEGGGKDNISVVLARPLAPFPARDGIFSKLTALLKRSS